MPPSRVFDNVEQQRAAALIVATVTAALDVDVDQGRSEHVIASALDTDDGISRAHVLGAAAVLVGKFLGDEAAVWHVNPAATVARLGAWVAGDELARGG